MTTIAHTAVADLPLFRTLPKAQVEAALGEARSCRYAKGTHFFDQDEEAHSFFVLLDGHLRVVRLTPDGQQVTVRYIGPGEIFGVAMAIGRTTYPATAIAVVDCVALVWPSAAWPRLIEQLPALAASTMRTLGSRLQDTQTRVVEMSTEEVERRIAHALARLARQSGRQIDGGVEIDFPMSRQDVAEMTGTTLHTVSRILSAWEEIGLVEGGRKRIVLKDLPRLSAIAEGGGGSD